MVAVLASWPADLEPRLQRPNDQQQKIAPLTLAYGSQPQPSSALSVPNATTIAQWGGAWPTDVGPLVPAPNERRQKIAPLTLPVGNQPAPQPALSTPELTIVGAWADVPLIAQRAPVSAWNQLVLASVPYTAPAAHLWAAWQDPAPVAQRRVSIAPLTLVYGSAPPPQAPAALRTMAAVVASWDVSVSPQTAPPNAAWNVPPVLASVRAQRVQAHLVASWQPPDPLPVGRLTSVVPTFPAVSQPPVLGARAPLVQILAAWTEAVTSVPRPSIAATSVRPSFVPAKSPPAAIILAWLETPLVRQPPVRIATLALPFVTAPKPRAPLPPTMLTANVLAWTEGWNAQTARIGVSLGVLDVQATIALSFGPETLCELTFDDDAP
jgi:hypothetical protein